MDNAEKFIKMILDGNMKKTLCLTYQRLQNFTDYSISQEKRDLERYKFFLNSFAYDEIKNVKVLSYLGDEDN